MWECSVAHIYYLCRFHLLGLWLMGVGHISVSLDVICGMYLGRYDTYPEWFLDICLLYPCINLLVSQSYCLDNSTLSSVTVFYPSMLVSFIPSCYGILFTLDQVHQSFLGIITTISQLIIKKNFQFKLNFILSSKLLLNKASSSI